MTLIITTLIYCLFTTMAAAADHSIHIEWGYTPPSDPPLSGYNLYQEGSLACTTNDPQATAMDCEVSLTGDTVNFTLTAIFSNGSESPHSAPFPFSIPTDETTDEAAGGNAPPIAAINPSVTTGEAPLTVIFDGSDSSDSDGTISSYTWNFSDNSSITGKQVSHTFTDADTFTASLQVTDDKGLTSTTSIPIIVTAPAQETNQLPTAAISITTSTGTAPLTVSFSASDSIDPDGTIKDYIWNFGDDSSASGVSATHTYAVEDNYIATLQITDDKGMTDVASTTITVNPPEKNTLFAVEIGEVAVNHKWKRVELEKSFNDPVIIAGPPSFNGIAPGVVRLRNIAPTGFEIQFAEWDYLDGYHATETVNYLVVEKGCHNVNGTIIEAGTLTGSTNFKTTNFQKSFVGTPIVVTTIASMNDTETISGRLRKVSPSGFEYFFREQEANAQIHANETVNYLAWEQGNGSIDAINYEASRTANTLTHAWKYIDYQNATEQLPFIFAFIQTTDGWETSAVRMTNSTEKGFQVKVEEEQSKDSEVNHTTEAIGYLVLTPDAQLEALEKTVTLAWTFDSEAEDTITGFNIYNNGELMCKVSDVTVRKVSCKTTLTNSNTFTISSVSTTGDRSDFSNQIQYNK